MHCVFVYPQDIATLSYGPAVLGCSGPMRLRLPRLRLESLRTPDPGHGRTVRSREVGFDRARNHPVYAYYYRSVFSPPRTTEEGARWCGNVDVLKIGSKYRVFRLKSPPSLTPQCDGGTYQL